MQRHTRCSRLLQLLSGDRGSAALLLCTVVVPVALLLLLLLFLDRRQQITRDGRRAMATCRRGG